MHMRQAVNQPRKVIVAHRCSWAASPCSARARRNTRQRNPGGRQPGPRQSRDVTDLRGSHRCSTRSATYATP